MQNDLIVVLVLLVAAVAFIVVITRRVQQAVWTEWPVTCEYCGKDLGPPCDYLGIWTVPMDVEAAAINDPTVSRAKHPYCDRRCWQAAARRAVREEAL